MMKNKVDEIWANLELANSSAPFLLRSYPGIKFAGFYLALTLPNKKRSLSFLLRKDSLPDLKRWNDLKEIKLIDYIDPTNSTLHYLLIQLGDNQHEDIFSVLCEDLIASISQFDEETEIIKILFNRLEKWRSLFDRVYLQGLSLEEQRGLFGELYFLRRFISNSSNFYWILKSWTGPEKQIRDFQFGNWSVEVKTTQGNNHQKVQISSERQLDTSNVQSLFLYHVSLDVKKQSGESLNQLIDSIITLLGSDFTAITQFRAKLLEAGYFDHHKYLYNDFGYFIRQEVFYQIKDDFPRIEEKDVRIGVGDVKYSIILSNFSDFIKPETEVFQKLIFNE